MRCRYCNKSISLLRRMNDASFCSDAHRQAYAEEQQLAMQRLASSAPSLGRTQKMAAINPGESVPPEGGPPFPLGPFPTPSAASSGIEARPLPSPAIVLFREREGAGRTRRPAPLAGPAAILGQIALRTPPAPCEPGPMLPSRVVAPRSLGSRPFGIDYRLRSQLFPILAAGNQPRRPAAPPVPWQDTSEALRALPRYGRPRPRELEAPARPVPLPPGFAAAPAPHHRQGAVPLRTPGGVPALRGSRAATPPGLRIAAVPEQLGQQPATGRYRVPECAPGALYPKILCLPGSGLQTIALSRAVTETAGTEWTEIWELLSPSPWRALLRVTTPAIQARIRPAAGAPKPLPFRAIATAGRETRPTAALNSRLPMAAITCVEAPPAKRGCRTSGGAGGNPHFAPLLLRYPSREERRRTISIRASLCGLVGVTAALSLSRGPLSRATGAPSRAWDGGWMAQPGHCAVPRFVLRRHAGLRSSTKQALSTLPLLPPAPPGPAVRYAGPWLAPAGDVRFSRSQAMAGPVPLAYAPCVEANLCPEAQPGPVLSARAAWAPIHVRSRLPRHETASAYWHGSAGPVPVRPPDGFPLPWSSRPRTVLTIAPPAVLPVPSEIRRPSGLRRISLRLYRIPNAQPMAQPLRRGPCPKGMEEWGSHPAIPPSQLRAGRCKPGRELAATGGWRVIGRDWQQRLSPGQLGRFWNRTAHLPFELKWIAMAVPLVIGIWVLARPSAAGPASFPPPATKSGPASEPADNLASVEAAPARAARKMPRVPGPAAHGSLPTSPPAPTPAPGGAWDSFTARIASRASVNLAEDFRNGLSSWEGKGDWARSWSYDKSGVVRPGQMAIFQPSTGLKDYVFEMKASIDRHAIQWMVRAANPQNYHFTRLNITPGAPLTRLELERWPVVNGRAGRVTRMPLPHGGANQTLYAIRVEVRGDSITTYLQDQVIDTFNDPRLEDGGIGLAGSGDDRPRIYGLRVFHQNDFLGKLCSFFAPPPINTQGSD